MGFLDSLQEFGNAVTQKALEKYKAMFKQATDYKLQEWWLQNQFNDEVDQRVKDLAENELRRRHLL